MVTVGPPPPPVAEPMNSRPRPARATMTQSVARPWCLVAAKVLLADSAILGQVSDGQQR